MATLHPVTTTIYKRAYFRACFAQVMACSQDFVQEGANLSWAQGALYQNRKDRGLGLLLLGGAIHFSTVYFSRSPGRNGPHSPPLPRTDTLPTFLVLWGNAFPVLIIDWVWPCLLGTVVPSEKANSWKNTENSSA